MEIVINVLLVVILIGSFFTGLQRGFVLQLLRLVSLVAAFIVAFLFYEEVAQFLEQWIPYPFGQQAEGTFLAAFDTRSLFYYSIAFLLLFIGTRIIAGFLTGAAGGIARLPVLRTINYWLGGVLGVLEAYVILFVVLAAAMLMPFPALEPVVNNSAVASFILHETPWLSGWYEQIMPADPGNMDGPIEDEG
ncbi:Uncharacterized membrane protein, required for colicin V production [Marinococcus luteus]|uniref:Uncharacterized membrane protein, required for colicin V production n=1 Tax=Marinococcus luteus TaxID=1122204 RepID=A0A1H2VLS9_9BACI|nr:CvpA family protein [Marinococcus luteus]SDW68924.1 Uncharacterized membrane protein, required for colicin V production [Marinococcus luteus]